MVRTFGAFVGGEPSQPGPVRRWYGAARTCDEWDKLRQDPELWLPNGNCLVYLHGKGQSRRLPSFKVPLQDLLSARCYPLIQRFLNTDRPCPRTPREFQRWGRDSWKQTVELYIPPPPTADTTQAQHYRLATRNFFAWVFRKSIVGSHLGGALVTLMHSMHEFRYDVKDNVEDMMDYLDEEGYLDFANHAEYALAMLYFAEAFQLSDLYIRAFSHCVGMSEQLFSSAEYQHISPSTKTLIRQARADLESRVYTATDMLKNLLDDELSETYMGIHNGTRAHLERFRSFLLSYYATRLGYYPPRSFTPSLYFSMRRDFDALYSLLVDTSYCSEDIIPSVAVGGMCTLQLVQAFDSRQHFTPLEHPLPLLPHFPQEQPSRRLAKLRLRARAGGRLSEEQRLRAHASLVTATNWQENKCENDLVKAYRRFEEQTTMSTNKADKQEKVSVMDARKIRWILVYALYQVLRSVTEVPPEVFDAENADYFVGVLSEGLPPWEEATPIDGLLRRQTEEVLCPGSGMSSPAPSVRWADPDHLASPDKIEIKPDIDYFALTHPEPSLNDASSSTLTSPSIKIPTRSSSLSHKLSRNNTIRKSMRLFQSSSLPVLEASCPTPVYHEIMVHGYGNGTNTVKLKKSRQTLQDDSCGMISGSSGVATDSDADTPSSTSDCSEKSVEEDSVTTPSPTLPMNEFPFVEAAPKPPRLRRQDVMSMIINPSRKSSTKSLRRPLSMLLSGHSSSSGSSNAIHNNSGYSEAYEQLVEEQRRQFLADSPEVEAHSRAIFPDFSRKQSRPRIVEPEDDWEAMQTFMDGGVSVAVDMSATGRDKDVMPAWEQYVDLGGLTELRP